MFRIERIISCPQEILGGFFGYFNGRTKRKQSRVLRTRDASVVTDSLAKYNLLADSFCSVFNDEVSSDVVFPIRTAAILDRVGLRYSCVRKAISELNDKLSCMPKAMPSYFLKRTSSAICLPLKVLFECGLWHAWLASYWKTAIVKSLLKTAPSTFIGDCRPISLT